MASLPARPASATRPGPPADTQEHHHTQRVGWLRAAVLGANDGIVSTASLMVGVGVASTDPTALLMTGVAGLVAGAMSMAAGEYVSVHTQADTEAADLARERVELAADPAAELRELTGLYVSRGLDAGLAARVAAQLSAHDALDAHAREELGISLALRARPVQAALSSAASFALGAGLPLAVAALAPAAVVVAWVGGSSLVCLAALGAAAARVGGSDPWSGALRITFWGALAMGVTAAAGAAFGALA